jgi:opacity protein-like surface antigen
MRILALSVAAFSLMASAAFAQDAAQPGPANPAVRSTDQNNSSSPVAGANSFTIGQAKSAIQAKGYTEVAGLKKDENGVWRGMAMKDGQSGPVSVDYQGNVN